MIKNLKISTGKYNDQGSAESYIFEKVLKFTQQFSRPRKKSEK